MPVDDELTEQAKRVDHFRNILVAFQKNAITEMATLHAELDALRSATSGTLPSRLTKDSPEVIEHERRLCEKFGIPRLR
jgi:hypothetical protein